MNLLLALPLVHFSLAAQPPATAHALPPAASLSAPVSPPDGVAPASAPVAEPAAFPVVATDAAATAPAIEQTADAASDVDAPDPVENVETPPPYTATEKAELQAHPSPDPLEGFNRVGYAISQPIDLLVLRPAAFIYKTVLPVPVRDGIRNALANLFSPTVLANDLLQARPRLALHTVLRVVINTTLGVGGLFDVAKRKPFNLAAHANGFGDTLGVWGAPPGPYLYLPVLGPTTIRDLFGAAGDAFTQPLLLDYFTRQNDQVVLRGTKKRTISIFSSNIQVSTYGLATMVVSGIDARAENDEALQVIKTQSVDPYAALRSSYLQDRAGEIAALKAKDGAPAQIPAFDDPLTDPAAPAKP